MTFEHLYRDVVHKLARSRARCARTIDRRRAQIPRQTEDARPPPASRATVGAAADRVLGEFASTMEPIKTPSLRASGAAARTAGRLRFEAGVMQSDDAPVIDVEHGAAGIASDRRIGVAHEETAWVSAFAEQA